jgi:hypothetical protein
VHVELRIEEGHPTWIAIPVPAGHEPRELIFDIRDASRFVVHSDRGAARPDEGHLHIKKLRLPIGTWTIEA